MNIIYGWFDDPGQTTPSYDPPRDAPCLMCGEPIVASDVRTHSLMPAGAVYAKRSYFYRTHKTCAESSPSKVQKLDGFIIDMIAENRD